MAVSEMVVSEMMTPKWRSPKWQSPKWRASFWAGLSGRRPYVFQSEWRFADSEEPFPFEGLDRRQAVYAEDVRVGDCLFVVVSELLRTSLASDAQSRHIRKFQSARDSYFEETRVTAVSIVREHGVYSPMTSNGDVVVNGILASCYNVVNNKYMQKTFFEVSQEGRIQRY
jgi:hypothetical protein